MQKSNGTVVIVDPYSTGSYLEAEFAARGWSSVAVLSSPAAPSVYGPLKHADRYREIITFESVDQVLAALAPHRPDAIIPGTEIGVSLADELADRAGLAGNGTALSRSRRDKFAMVEALRRNGVPAPESIVTTDADEVVRWATDRDLWPIVVKPVDSAGSDGVTFCDTPAEARAAFARLHDRPHQLGGHNDVVLAQELLRGQQFFVNTVSVDGHHYVAEIWKDVRRPVPGASLAYDLEELMEPVGEVQRVLTAYVFRVLDALGIAWGPAHSEIMLTDRGPVLIETASRMQGTILPDSVRAATGQNHVTLTVDCYTDPDRLRARAGTAYPLHRHVRVVSLIAPHDGHLAAGAAAELANLPSTHAILGSIAAGTPVKRTVDLFTSPASLYLIADEVAELTRDYARIRELERSGLYADSSYHGSGDDLR